MKTSTDSINSISIRKFASERGIAEADIIRATGIGDSKITIYELGGVRVAETNGEPLWEEADPAAFAELLADGTNHYAAIAPDLNGPAYGTGLTEAEALSDARVWGFEGDDIRVIRITRQSFDRIRAGNPDAVELAD